MLLLVHENLLSRTIRFDILDMQHETEKVHRWKEASEVEVEAFPSPSRQRSLVPYPATLLPQFHPHQSNPLLDTHRPKNSSRGEAPNPGRHTPNRLLQQQVRHALI